MSDLKPKIRFKGFTDDWEQRKVSDMAERYDNLRIPVAANLRKSGETPYYGANGIQDYVDGFTHDGEFILVAEDGANDLKNYPVNYVNGRIWVNNHAHVLQGKASEADTRFLGYAISQADIESVLVGGGRAKLNADVLMNIDLLMPEKSEQQKIGAFFASLDNLITLHQRKCDAYKKMKRGMMQKLFNQEVRFKKDDGTDYADWEERVLGDIATNLKTGTLKATDLKKDGQYPVVNSGLDLYGYYDNYNNEGDVFTIASRGENVGNVHYMTDKFWAGGLCYPYRANTGYCTQYLAYYMDYSYHILRMLFMAQTGVPAINKSDLETFSFEMPTDIEEQTKIANCLAEFDNLIDASERRLEAYKLLKKAMLQKMFV